LSILVLGFEDKLSKIIDVAIASPPRPLRLEIEAGIRLGVSQGP
jgi:hypothetical protein